MTHPNQTSAQKKFPDTYTHLSISRQDVLKCLSVIYQHISRTNLLTCLNKAEYKNEFGKRYTHKNIEPYLEDLEKKKLIEMTAQGLCCNEEIVELASREAVRDDSFATLAEVVQKNIPLEQRWNNTVWYRTYEQGLREIRIAFYSRMEDDSIIRILRSVQNQFPGKTLSEPLVERIFFNPLDTDLLHSRSPFFIEMIIIPRLIDAVMLLEPANNLLAFVRNYDEINHIEGDGFQSAIALHSICRGEMTKTLQEMDSWEHSSKMFSYRGWLALLQGNTDESLQLYRQGLELLKKETGKRKVSFSNLAGIFYCVALLKVGGNENLQEALEYVRRVKKQKENFMSYCICDDVEQTLLLAMGRKSQAEKTGHSFGTHNYYDFPSVLIAVFTLAWQGEAFDQDDFEIIEVMRQRAEQNGYYWFAKEATAILLENGYMPDINRKRYEKLKTLCPLPDFFKAIQPQENWEKVLDALSHLNSNANESKATGNERMVWLIEFDDDYYECEIVPRLQKLGKNGKWSKGRAVALSTLCSNVNTLTYLSEQDKHVVAAIQKSHSSSWGYYGSSSTYSIQQSQALPALVDHPLLFWADHPTTRLELVKGSPELHVVKKRNRYEISLSPEMDEGESFRLIQETPTRLRYIPLTQDYARIWDIIGNSVDVPFQAKDKVLEALSQVSKILTVHSDIGGASIDAKTVEADARPYVHLLPVNEGMQVEVLCRPFSTGGSYYQPGSGGKTVLAEVDGVQLQTVRDLEQERKNAEFVQEKCPTLNRVEVHGNEWTIDDPETSLELLCELRDLGDEAIVEWPKGESMRVTPTVSFSHFSMGIKKDNNWFGATGSLQVDEELTLDMKKLLALTANSPSRFVQLDDGRFLALTKAFKKRIEELRAYSESHGDGIRFSPLAAPALEEFTEEIGDCTTDKHWKKNLKHFQTLGDTQLPSTLQATLRDYQLEGFSWLARLSALQVGACLADDMGLGKTIQALAAILLRAPEGPTLVVAPTSVMMNWQDEATRFTPTLNVQYFGNGNRQEILDGLGEFDLVICSYGLLQSEGEMLAGVEWQTVVLDEAQAIKNMQTKRSQSAMKLQASFRLITTGTPIENHLGELWNLFRFLNPGLLGSFANFKRKFANPIEKHQDRTATNHLRKLIQPFILRRLKHAVLQELPSRTEVTMQVEMSAEEAAMYEAQRLQALEALAEEQTVGAGQQHIQVLAEITRLRRFCCNPELVVPDVGIASSKLKVFTTIVKELLENNHKALVFSQFVGHLALIRERLESLGISYQYLDGSTTPQKRKKAVKDFQAGKGDIFLISLKAGGAGLNLTAADYVIHMDPWWNPAVEDQASDRAHRIGQQRPVTIYRLVVKDSIEEKIVALHKEKRDLADGLLAGSDMSGKISTSELLKLLRNE
ncbi:DEAD/DEAH box helicase [Desulfosediminicola flagellatus]|uniref:DEAD/DEAH box helicase n=1 Tax=Desulfosediminicola flagellatus TaxID=2569541 RepID=UPI00142EA662|nr:DEAD/DEAH box helicase [Desulfosediminicola flagellatus]